MPYHINKINKGVLGEFSKINEELEEFEDALTQNCKVMAILELSDLVGAVSCYLEKHHPSITIEDLIIMSKVTESAFKDGSRS